MGKKLFFDKLDTYKKTRIYAHNNIMMEAKFNKKLLNKRLCAGNYKLLTLIKMFNQSTLINQNDEGK